MAEILRCLAASKRKGMYTNDDFIAFRTDHSCPACYHASAWCSDRDRAGNCFGRSDPAGHAVRCGGADGEPACVFGNFRILSACDSVLHLSGKYHEPGRYRDPSDQSGQDADRKDAWSSGADECSCQHAFRFDLRFRYSGSFCDGFNHRTGRKRGWV